jgi:phosphoserine aminotransferase
MVKRNLNFNPGPAALPLSVLKEIQAEFLDYKGSGMSIVELSHRSKVFEGVLNDAASRIKRLLRLGEDYQVLFLQGGASLQFSMVPMNLLPENGSADYVDTGTWATLAIKEARRIGRTVRVAASSEDRQFSYIPREIAVDPSAAYVHVTSNNTIRGTQWQRFPNPQGVPLVADMSSDIMGRLFAPEPFGLIYAGAQKNLGAAGVTVVIIRRDLLERVPENLPTMLRYTTYGKSNSLHNTAGDEVAGGRCGRPRQDGGAESPEGQASLRSPRPDEFLSRHRRERESLSHECHLPTAKRVP